MPRGRLTDIFLTERYQKDVYYIKIYDTYTPNYNKTELTPKFYSKYEGVEADEVNPEVLKNLIYVQDILPKYKRKWPETVNEGYGWFIEQSQDTTKELFNYPKIDTEITKFGMQLMQNKSNKKK